MADVRPFRALHYDSRRTGGLAAVVSPPYDVIDDAQRALLLAGSPHNVVAIDLPRGQGDPYEHAAETLAAWRRGGILVQDERPALWPLEQEHSGPDGRRRTRRGFLARVRVEDYGPGRVRPHERTHPGPREDRLRLTRATRANLSPIFSLYDDPGGAAWAALEPAVAATEPVAEVADDDGTVHRLWRVADEAVSGAVAAALRDTELLIADGHHRYETARAYAREPDAPAGARFVLMCLVALQDPGLTVYPTHRLLSGLDAERRRELDAALRRDWAARDVAPDELEPTGDGPLRMGMLDGRDLQPRMLWLRDPAIADAALSDKPEAYRRLDTAVLEALILRDALGMSDEDIAHLDGLGYARSALQARASVESGESDVAFFMRGTPVRDVRDVAAAGETMPPKSTYFFPKMPAGLVFNLLDDD